MRRSLCALGLAGAAALFGCGGDGGTGPVAGELVVNLATGVTGTRGILFRIVGDVNSVSLPSGSTNRLFSASLGGDTLQVAVIAPAGGSLTSGVIARINVPDVNQSSSYIASVRQAAGANYALQTTALYTITIARQ
jgi:hypothetical protein